MEDAPHPSQAWAENYEDQGLLVIGVHTPEFDLERDPDNVRRAAKAMGIGYPIAIESDYAIWNAFGNRYWPAFYFQARDLHLVMGPGAPGTPVRFRVRIDGQPPGAAHGTDVDDQGNGTVTEPRLYQLVRQPGLVAERTFEITFLEGGVEAHVFTFG